MNPVWRLGLLGALALTLGAADPGVTLTPELASGEWKPLLTALAAKGGVQARFTERRYFPFRREPTILKGVLRISPKRGLSLQYTEPQPSILIADADGLVIRDSDGKSRAMAAGSREAGAIASLLPIMRFDMLALYPRFDVRALRTGENWRFEFSPKEPVAASTLGTITVDGVATDVTHLEFRHSPKQRVEIDVEDTHSGVIFAPDALKAFFR
jgi:hypothetical protein